MTEQWELSLDKLFKEEASSSNQLENYKRVIPYRCYERNMKVAATLPRSVNPDPPPRKSTRPIVRYEPS